MTQFPKDHALLVIDIQNDFCPKGRLAVAQGDEIIPLANSAGVMVKALLPRYVSGGVILKSKAPTSDTVCVTDPVPLVRLI